MQYSKANVVSVIEDCIDQNSNFGIITWNDIVNFINASGMKVRNWKHVEEIVGEKFVKTRRLFRLDKSSREYSITQIDRINHS
jgi:hypothetical protein